MNLEDILEAMKNGICPFTKKPYDCARCDFEQYKTDWFNHGVHTCHMALYIGRPLLDGARGWRDTLRYFEPQDRKGARTLIESLLKMSVEYVPIGNCDFEHFCFRRGCNGHKIETEAAK